MPDITPLHAFFVTSSRLQGNRQAGGRAAQE